MGSSGTTILLHMAWGSSTIQARRTGSGVGSFAALVFCWIVHPYFLKGHQNQPKWAAIPCFCLCRLVTLALFQHWGSPCRYGPVCERPHHSQDILSTIGHSNFCRWNCRLWFYFCFRLADRIGRFLWITCRLGAFHRNCTAFYRSLQFSIRRPGHLVGQLPCPFQGFSIFNPVPDADHAVRKPNHLPDLNAGWRRLGKVPWFQPNNRTSDYDEVCIFRDSSRLANRWKEQFDYSLHLCCGAVFF